MDNIIFPITQINGNMMKIVVSTSIYAKDAINATCYKYTGHCFVHQELTNDNSITVTMTSKNGEILDLNIGKQFCNDLIDQQVRYSTEQKYGHIRDLIVEEAFKPVQKV